METNCAFQKTLASINCVGQLSGKWEQEVSFFIFHLVTDSHVSYPSLQLQHGDKANDSC